MLTCWIRISLMNTRVEELLLKDYKRTFNPKGNQSWIFIGRTEAEAPILWPPDEKSQLIGKDPDDGKHWGQKGRGWQRMRWLDGTMESVDMSLSKLWETVKGVEAWHAEVHGVTKSWTQLSDWTAATWKQSLDSKVALQCKHPPEDNLSQKLSWRQGRNPLGKLSFKSVSTQQRCLSSLVSSGLSFRRCT